jgi:hypothetical protein
MKKTTLFILFFAFTTLLYSSSVEAAQQIYYVTYNGSGNQNGQSYSDSWSWRNFLSSSNWSSNEHDSKIDPGDTVYLSGDFNIGSSDNQIPGSGSSGNYIVIDGDDGVHPSATLIPTYQYPNSAIRTNSNSYLEFRDLYFSGSQNRAILLNGSHFKVHDCVVNGTYAKGIYCRYASYVDIYDNEVITDESNDGCLGDGIKVKASHHINVYRNFVSDWDHTNIHIANISSDYANGDTHDVDVYDNYVNLPNRGYGRAFAINSSEESNHVYNVYIHHNYFDSMRARSQIFSSRNIHIYNNIFYNTLSCCPTGNEDGCSEAAYNEICKGSYYRMGQSLSLSTLYGELQDVYIKNNTFYKSAECAIFILFSDNLNNIEIDNNIFYNGANAATPQDSPPGSEATETDYTIYMKNTDNTYSNFSFKNNIVYSPERATDIAWDGSTYTVSEFNSAFNWASNNISQDPLLADPEHGDFSLQNKSPAIDAGSDLENQYEFAWTPGTTLPPAFVMTTSQNKQGSNWEIGAYVYEETIELCPPKDLKINN